MVKEIEFAQLQFAKEVGFLEHQMTAIITHINLESLLQVAYFGLRQFYLHFIITNQRNINFNEIFSQFYDHKIPIFIVLREKN